MEAQDIIEKFQLIKHPAAGYFKEIYTSEDTITPPSRFPGTRPACSTIYYLLESPEISSWHKMRQDEIWFYHAGEPAKISIKDPKERVSEYIIGNETQTPEANFQVAIPAQHGFTVELIKQNSFIFVSCVTAPGFGEGDCTALDN